MYTFEPVIGKLKLLKVPFGDAWTGVVLYDGERKILIDSGAKDSDVDEVILPALRQEGYTLRDVDYLLNTHSHGDHIGGFARIRELAPDICVAAAETDWQNVENPAALAIRTRGRFPAVSPKPQSELRGVKVDRILRDGDVLDSLLTLVTTPGHDGGCVCWIDRETGTAVTGDSLQGNGTPSQGIGFYKDLNLYRHSVEKLLGMGVENLLCGHDYDRVGYRIFGKDAVRETLDRCLALTVSYQKFVDRELAAGNADPVEIAAKLIREIGCGMPAYLFMAVWSVTEHIRLSEITLKPFL